MANKSIRETFMATYSTNVFGVATLIKSCLPLLKQSNFPRIVNVTSGLGSLTIMSDWNSIWASARHPVSRHGYLDVPELILLSRHTTHRRLP
jgi:NAD(P)-dependent dehydrogenase (short-subunit alcohol dehydrogenase family)